jgi:DNA-binding MarR family transcriptional regulator
MNTPNDALVRRSARTLVEVVPAVNRSLRVLTAELLRHVITVPQYRVLVLLKDHPESSLKDLADREGVEPPTVSRTVDTLVEKRLVDRQTDGADRRCLRLSLLPLGTALVDRVRTDVAAALESELARWDASALEHLVQALDGLGASALTARRPEASHA